MDKLKPCPFCGESHAVLLKPTCKQTDAYDSHDRAFPMVCCPLCNAEKHGENWDQSGESAIKAWNTRTTDTALAAAEAKLAYFEELAGERLVQISDDAERIAALEEALEPLADIVTAFSADRYDDHQALVLMEAGDARRAAALLKEKE